MSGLSRLGGRAARGQLLHTAVGGQRRLGVCRSKLQSLMATGGQGLETAEANAKGKASESEVNR